MIQVPAQGPRLKPSLMNGLLYSLAVICVVLQLLPTELIEMDHILLTHC